MSDQIRTDGAGGDLRDRLRQTRDRSSGSAQLLSNYFLTNLNSLPFETGATLASKLRVSEATIGRFCRTLGYRHFKDLKRAIKYEAGEKAWLIGDELRAFAENLRSDSSERARGMEMEIAAIINNYQTATSPEFKRVVQRLATRPKVFVSGFQTERGHGQYLAHCLQYLRPGVELLDLAGGSLHEAFLSDPAEACLVLIDMRRYSRLAQEAMNHAREAGIPVTFITDPYCGWAQSLADEVLVVQTDFNQFWDATSAIASLIGLIVNGVFADLGPEVEDRMTRISDLHRNLTGHVGDPPRSS